MFENLAVSAWIGIRVRCEMTYCINTEDDVDFMLDDGQRRFDFAIETEALRKLLDVGGQALADLDNRAVAAGAARAVGEQHTSRLAETDNTAEHSA